MSLYNKCIFNKNSISFFCPIKMNFDIDLLNFLSVNNNLYFFSCSYREESSQHFEFPQNWRQEVMQRLMETRFESN